MKKLTVTFEKKQRKSTHKVNTSISYPEDGFGAFVRLWKDLLMSNLHPKDKADVLRFLIFALTVIVITALFVLNHL